MLRARRRARRHGRVDHRERPEIAVRHVEASAMLGAGGGLTGGTVARYNFMTPNVSNDMTGQSSGSTCFALTTDRIALGAPACRRRSPQIMASRAYTDVQL